jgi:hypothetical protein
MFRGASRRSRAKIDANGVWTRRVPWERNGQWRTDIFKSVLSDPRLRQCCFVFKGGPTVLIPAAELRRVVEGGPEHYGGMIWGPFNIDPGRGTMNGVKVHMRIM